MDDDRKHQLLRLCGTTDTLPEHQTRNDLFNLAARTEAQFNQRGDTIIEESITITPDDFERFKPEFDKLRKMFKVSEHETTLPDGKMVRVVTWVSHQQPTITMRYH